MTVKPKSTVNAAAVSRALKAAGLTRGDSMASGMVRGWHTYYAGYKVEQDYEHTTQRRTRTRFIRGGSSYQEAYTHHVNIPKDRAFVTYQHGDSARYWDDQKRDARAREVMAQAAEVLTGKGYAVEVVSDGKMLFVTPGA